MATPTLRALERAKRLLVILAVPLVFVGVASGPSAPSARAALPAGCHSTDAFGPSITSMQHFFHCATGRYLPVVKHVDPNPTLAPTATGQPDAAQLRGPGGPSCEWAVHYFAKWCYSRGIPYLICDQFFYNTSLNLNGHHCANPYYSTGGSFTSLWHHVVNLTRNHALRRCVLSGGTTAAGGVITGVIVKGASASGGPIGLAVASGVGCVGGALSYWWH